MKGILRYLRDYKKESVLAPLFKMLEACFELLIPIVMAHIIDTGIKNQDMGYVLRMCLVMIALGIIGLSCSLTAQYFSAKAATGFGTALRSNLFRHITSLSYNEIDTIGTSTLLTRMTSDINQIQTGVNLVLRLFLRSPFIVFGAMIMSFTIDVKSAMTFVVTIPALSIVVFGIMLVSIPLFKKVQARLDKVMLLTRENLEGARVIRAFNRQQKEVDEFDKSTDDLMGIQLYVGRISAFLNPVTYVIINLATVAIIWIAAGQTDIGILSQGKVVALINYMSQILVELVKLANLIINITKSIACAKRINVVFDTKPSITEVEEDSALSEAQKVDGLDDNVTTKRYIHHYNFPSYSVGETKPSRGPGRREIGHGALAERALIPVLPSEKEFPYAIRAVSETFESNGSTSMASTCASCMSLMAAGVPIKSMVAGISCGLVTGDTDDDYVVLTDIQGLEDFFGDMDFKVTGTTEGITAIQMDIKIHGLTRPIVEEAIARTREARLFIMDTCMKPAIAEPRKTVGEFAPKIIQTKIDPAKIGEVVGQRGKVINAIIDECGVKIDITDDGFVSVCGVEQAGMDQAMKYINTIVQDFEEGQIYEGKVVSIKEFGAFVEFAPGKEGMVHISKIAKERIEHVEDVLTLGDKVRCKCMGKDKMGRLSFSIKDAE